MSGFTFESLMKAPPEELRDNLTTKQGIVDTEDFLQNGNEIIFKNSTPIEPEKPLSIDDFQDTAELFAGLINDGMGILNGWVLKFGFGIKDIPAKKKEMAVFEKNYDNFQRKYAEFRRESEPKDPQLLTEYQDRKEFFYLAAQKYEIAKGYWDEFPQVVKIYEECKLSKEHLKYLSQPIAKYLLKTRTRELPPWLDLTIAIGKVYSPIFVNYGMLKGFKQLSADMVDENAINNEVLLARIQREKDEIYNRHKNEQRFGLSEQNQANQQQPDTIPLSDFERGRPRDGEKLLDGTDNIE